jgi:hypothetical protein
VVKFQAYIQQVLGLNLELDTRYIDLYFCVVSYIPPDISEVNISARLR